MERQGVDESQRAVYNKNIYVNTHLRGLREHGLVVPSKENKVSEKNRLVRTWELADKASQIL